jgi:hypothetical protein
MKIIELLIVLVLIVLAVLLLNPFSFYMPNAMVMTLMGCLIGIAALFAGIVWKESAGDEREALHRMFAGRVAFITGTVILVAGIAVQSLTHTVDVWLVLALIAMVLAKMVGRMYAGRVS